MDQPEPDKRCSGKKAIPDLAWAAKPTITRIAHSTLINVQLGGPLIPETVVSSLDPVLATLSFPLLIISNSVCLVSDKRTKSIVTNITILKK